MKKMLIILIALLLSGCVTQELITEVPDTKYDLDEEIPLYDIEAYIETIEPIITDLDYTRIDSVFSDDSQPVVAITDKVIENILQIYNDFEVDHSTYDVINFFDLHVKSLDAVDIDILLLKIINKIEEDYDKHKDLVLEEQFNYMIQDYITRITDSFIDSYTVDSRVINDYPNMYQYLDRLRGIVNGGYQIRRYKDQYFMFTDYESFMGRYKEFLSDETKEAVDILMRESRNLVVIGDEIQLENESIAFKINEIEAFLNKYPSSEYYNKIREYYVDYFMLIINNPDNLEEVGVDLYSYKVDVKQEFNQIVARYSEGHLARILSEFLVQIYEDGEFFKPETLEDMKKKIEASY